MAKLLKYFTDPFDKAYRLVKIIQFNGGIIGSVKTIMRTDDLKIGKLVGEDKYGNKYFENDYYFFARNRWVIFSDSVGRDIDGSQVPAEWHRWLTQVCDEPPTPEGVMPVQRKWLADHTPNTTGTKNEYVPYSTGRPKIESWQPPKS